MFMKKKFYICLAATIICLLSGFFHFFNAFDLVKLLTYK